MNSYRARTRIEAAILLLVILVASVLVRVGQAGDTPRKDHSKIDCSLCHLPVADIASDEPPIIDLSRQCVTCHQPRAGESETELSFHLSTDKRCTSCHSFHESDHITAGDQTFRFRFDKRSPQMTLCASCHGPGENPRMISDGHKRAALLYHADYGQLTGMTPSQACMLCHAENSATTDAAAGLQIPQFAEHEDHPVGVKVVPGSGEPGNRIRFAIDRRLKLYDGKIECQTCHSLSSSTKGRLREFSSFTELCNGCHLVD